MYGREQRVLLRHYLEQGLTKAELARTLGVSIDRSPFHRRDPAVDRSTEGAAHRRSAYFARFSVSFMTKAARFVHFERSSAIRKPHGDPSQQEFRNELEWVPRIVR